MNRVVLHLGAHKTATTFIQKQLERIAADFPHEIGYIPLKEMRREITPALRAERPLRYEMLKNKGVGSQYTDAPTLILSDENLLGSARLAAKGQLYLSLSDILDRLKSLFPGVRHFKVLFSIRDYGDFAVSLYCEYLRHNPFCTLQNFLSNFDLSKSNWLTVYKALTGAFGKKAVSFYDFQNFEPQDFLSRLLPKGLNFQIYNFEESSRISRPTLTKEFLSVLEYIHEIYGGTVSQKVFSLLENSPFSKELNTGEKICLPPELQETFHRTYGEHYRILTNKNILVNGYKG